MSNSEHWLQCLQENGYRPTAPRRAVVEIIASSRRVLNPMEVFDLARECYPRLGLVTVYRTIEMLEKLGILQRVHLPTNCQGFIRAIEGHQHLLICQNCGMVEYFGGDQEILDHLVNDVEEKSKYIIQDHWLQFFGLCADCKFD